MHHDALILLCSAVPPLVLGVAITATHRRIMGREWYAAHVLNISMGMAGWSFITLRGALPC